MKMIMFVALLSACVDDFRGPPVELPITDSVYSCQYERDAEVGYVELCWDREPDALADAIVAQRARRGVGSLRCDPRGDVPVHVRAARVDLQLRRLLLPALAPVTRVEGGWPRPAHM